MQMRANSTFTSFLNKRLVMNCCVSIVMTATLFIASSFRKDSNRDLRAKEVNLIIRQLGHRLLLQSGDSTSRVMPVTEITEGTFLLKFENELLFSHDSLLTLSRTLLPVTHFAAGYMVTVHDCEKGDIVYGFGLNKSSPDLLACSGRHQPAGCYTIQFAFKNFYNNVEEKKASAEKQAKQPKTGKVDQQTVSPKLAELNTESFNNNFDRATKEVTSVKVEALAAEPESEVLRNGSFTSILYSGIIVLLVIAFLIWRFGKVVKPVVLQKQNQAIIGESLPESAALGQFLFNGKKQCLLLGSEVISLTDKESKVLELLHQNFGELIPRDVLIQKIWIDEGVITGRSLDVFVSKLRKKLSRDPELRITNVHGKGYKLEVSKEII